MDLICRNRWDGAFYHVLHDCVVPNICNIESLQRSHGSACYDNWQDRWIQLFAPNSKKVNKCVNAPLNKPCMVGAVLHRLLPEKHQPSDIVVLQRANTRVFVEESFNALRSELGKKGKVVVYTGKEDPRKTVEIFQKARYLVGYHGAGLVNAYFMNNETRILEITTYTDLNNSVPWRSNMKEVTKYGRFDTSVLKLPIQQLLRTNNVSYTTHDTDHFIKDLKFVSLTKSDVRKIVDFVQ